jgi:hypothetical protein
MQVERVSTLTESEIESSGVSNVTGVKGRSWPRTSTPVGCGVISLTDGSSSSRPVVRSDVVSSFDLFRSLKKLLWQKSYYYNY